jgi:hypothetical protein
MMTLLKAPIAQVADDLHLNAFCDCLITSRGEARGPQGDHSRQEEGVGGCSAGPGWRKIGPFFCASFRAAISSGESLRSSSRPGGMDGLPWGPSGLRGRRNGLGRPWEPIFVSSLAPFYGALSRHSYVPPSALETMVLPAASKGLQEVDAIPTSYRCNVAASPLTKFPLLYFDDFGRTISE